MKKCRLVIYLFISFFIFQSCQKDDEELDTVKDIDGNIYKTVKIGTQTWMAENLKTTKYNEGSAIPLVTDNTAWSMLTTPGYCWYNNDQLTYGNTYGALYNWYAVNTGKLCPSGWHVPKRDEWWRLTGFLGVDSIAGGKMKEAGNAHWGSPNTGATNESGFSGLPGGDRNNNGGFSSTGSYGYWWSSTDFYLPNSWPWNRTHAWAPGLGYGYANVYIFGNPKESGLSVRCLMDL